ncbi:hypothetical protein L202_02266 [Cryptococcus amylolentus CBS 6039]|uniref:Diacylglycerol O-acyltransferase n=2 Tax=Cryptococcus amylolentus TaxID=104669 RepID=A0A1E3I009_9TREE|nr:hypothetical protein L202_02266 [Cryptococcus amylolentus CBS 6039]ODN81922.1 hypothetical protein L202_02266 [Cryptococcus amylolentus CBS 6039]ODO09926.1 hypothetical protein I350_02149 [Cryptococcus amylolentus CBS 6273]
MSPSPGRPLALRERLSLARTNAGYPAIITMAVVYPSSSSAPSDVFLARRIAEIQTHFPQLYARVAAAHTTDPVQILRDRPWKSSEVLRKGVYLPQQTKDKEFAAVLHLDGQRMMQEDFDNAPLWQITVYASTSQSRVYVALSVEHVMIDGRGMANLFQALLAEDISHLPQETLEATPRAEDTINMRPSLAFAVPLIWYHIVLPRLPSFLQTYFAPAKPWPAEQIDISPLASPSALSLFSLSSGDVSQLKALARLHKVPALNAVLLAMYGLAVWSKYGYTLRPFRLVAISARSERDASLGHAYALSNYVSSHQIDVCIQSGDDFWTIARKVSYDTSNPRAISHARMRMGMIAQIPDGIYISPNGEPDPCRPTLFEDFLLNNASLPTPFTNGFALSNLGLLPLPEGAEDLAWAQVANGLGGEVFTVAVVGHQDGVRLSTSFKDGSAVRRSEVEDVEQIFGIILGRLLDGMDTVDELIRRR